PSLKSALPSPLFAVASPDWSVIEVARLFLPNTSPISSIGTPASMPVLTVTIMSMAELEAPAARVAPTGKAIRVVLERGAGAVLLQVADNGAVVSALVVYKVPFGNV